MKKFLLIFLCLCSYAFSDPAQDYEQALGLKGVEREKKLNQALGGFLKNDDLANTAGAFYELQQYPWAVLYYSMALEKEPGNEFIRKSLKNALSQTSAPVDVSLPSRFDSFTVFLLFFILSFILAALYLWVPRKLILAFALGSSTLALMMMLLAAWTHYFSPLPAVMVNSSALYQSSSAKSGVVGEDPLFAGTFVQVLEITKQGNWLKVKTKEGHIGYLPLKTVRLI